MTYYSRSLLHTRCVVGPSCLDDLWSWGAGLVVLVTVIRGWAVAALVLANVDDHAGGGGRGRVELILLPWESRVMRLVSYTIKLCYCTWTQWSKLFCETCTLLQINLTPTPDPDPFNSNYREIQSGWGGFERSSSRVVLNLNMTLTCDWPVQQTQQHNTDASEAFDGVNQCLTEENPNLWSGLVFMVYMVHQSMFVKWSNTRSGVGQGTTLSLPSSIWMNCQSCWTVVHYRSPDVCRWFGGSLSIKHWH